jgi:hypothetical protein
LVTLNATAQTWIGENIKLFNPGGYPLGVNIDTDYSGGWAREFSFSRNRKGKLLVFGAYGNADELKYGYIGGNTTDDHAAFQTWMVFLPDGKVGIGTTTPEDYLQVQSKDYRDIFSLKREDSAQGNTFDFRITSNPNGVQRLNNRSLTIVAEQASDFALLTDPTQQTPQFIVKKNGNVAIGVQDPQYKLDVLGTIRARELKVDMQGADFVFEEDYKLRPLEEVGAFVKEHKHLPEVASAEEMERDGVKQSELNQKLLQKIEELTLYVLEMNKENQKLKLVVEEQKTRLEEIDQLRKEIQIVKEIFKRR